VLHSGPTTPTTLWRLLELMRRAPGSTLSNLRSGRPRKIVQYFIESFPHASLSWDDLAWLCGRTDLPVLVKGILHPDDARRVVEEGADGVWVSNHGGRQIDGGIAALDALPDVVAQDAGRPRRGPDQAHERLQGGGLARPVGAHEAEDLVPAHAEADPVQDPLRPQSQARPEVLHEPLDADDLVSLRRHRRSPSSSICRAVAPVGVNWSRR